MAFPEEFLQELKSRNDITDIVSSYVSLKRKGRNMVGLCPFHGEKTPSFNIYSESESFYCFGCGVGGDVISFIMKIENLDYVEAVKFLCQRAGMEMPENSYDDSMSKLRTRIFEANREAARFFYSALNSKQGAVGLDYFHKRALSDRTIKKFGLGYADGEWSSLCDHLKSKGFKDNEIIAANLGVQKKNGNGVIDRFKNRVMFPIIDLRGNVIAFGGRIMTDEKPKYLNTSDTPVFKKSSNLFSLNNAKNSGVRTLILCEGYMDVIAVNQAGFTNAVATLGTALTSEQAVLMKRYADEVIICYDSDEAGQKATARAIPILRNSGLLIRVLNIPKGKDPDEFIRSKGADGPAAFKSVIEKSGNDIQYHLQKLRTDKNLQTPEGRVAYLEEASKVIANISSPIERDIYINEICKEFNVDKNAFSRQVASIIKRKYSENSKKEFKKIRAELSRQNDKINIDHHKKPRSSSAEELLVVYLVKNPDSAKEISKRLAPDEFSNGLIKRFYEYFLNRINNGFEPLTNISADFSKDETSKFYEIFSQTIPVALTYEAMNEYIKTIKEENSKLSKEDIATMSGDDIKSYLESLKKAKK